jgi:hypothetical protein
MRIRLLVLSLFVVLVPVACTVVGDGKVARINPPAGLDDTLPSSTTSSTTTTELVSTTSALLPTTIVQTEPVRLYFIASGQLTYVATPLPAPAALGQIVAALQDGPPPGDLGRGLRSAVPAANVAEIKVTSNNSGVALVELPTTFFDNISLSDQRLVTAQLVLTLTDSRGIGQVQFNIAVPKPNSEVAPSGQLLARADFLSLLESSSTPASPPGSTADTTTTVHP